MVVSGFSFDRIQLIQRQNERRQSTTTASAIAFLTKENSS